MMKKLIALLLCLSMALTFTACRIVIDGEESSGDACKNTADRSRPWSCGRSSLPCLPAQS